MTSPYRHDTGVDHGTICGRSCANSRHHKPLRACVHCTFVNPNSSRRRPEKIRRSGLSIESFHPFSSGTHQRHLHVSGSFSRCPKIGVGAGRRWRCICPRAVARAVRYASNRHLTCVITEAVQANRSHYAIMAAFPRAEDAVVPWTEDTKLVRGRALPGSGGFGLGRRYVATGRPGALGAIEMPAANGRLRPH